jgi:two-component system response regulator
VSEPDGRICLQVLLVEDDPGDVRLVQEAVQDSGAPIQLSTVGDGVEAMAYLRREGRYGQAGRPDLVLLDLKMPKKGGLEVLAEIKQDQELKRIPVFILTTSDAPGDIHLAYNLQASCYITKPEDLDEYRDVIDSIMEFCLKLMRLPQN